MTYKEAINEIEYLIGDGIVLEHIFVDLPQESVSALEVAIEALEKQIPKKVKKIMPGDWLFSDGWPYKCPTCGCAVGENKYAIDYTDDWPYCDNCGQALDYKE